MNTNDYMITLGLNARNASRKLARAKSEEKNDALEKVAIEIESNNEKILEANAQDLEYSKNKKLSSALLDRLTISQQTIDNMAMGLREVIELPDPTGRIEKLTKQPSGIKVGHMHVPLGVIGIIYESRPNVTADATALCLKSGNAAILRGGSEAINSNLAIGACINDGLRRSSLPADSVQVIKQKDRDIVNKMLSMNDYIDVIIPRGGKGLIEKVSQESSIPTIKHLDGICHTYVDEKANIDMAVSICDNAKTQRYGTCNTMETLLIHQKVAHTFLVNLANVLIQKGVEIRGDREALSIVDSLTPAEEKDWYTEYLGPILSVKIVPSLDAAIEHITKYGSKHTDAIVTDDEDNAERFVREVDSSSVMINTSTRFADGFEYGLGAEIGISTDKLHARGPVGLVGLTSKKWVVVGEGQVRK